MSQAGWERTELAKHCEVLSGFPFASASFTDDAEDVHLVKGENIGQGEVLWEISKHWPRSQFSDLQRFKLAPGDVVLAMDRPWVPAGLKFARIEDTAPDALLVQRVARLRATQGLEQPFLACLISSPQFEAYIKNAVRGVTVPHISGKEIGAFTFDLPPVGAQRAIAAVLQDFDRLIDNNRRRIKLLEDSVRLLFDEWFVNAKASHWPTFTLQQLCADEGGIQTGPFGSQLHQSDYSEEGVPVVMPKDLATMKIDTQTIARIPEHLADELGRHRMQRGDIVFGRRGEIGRRAYIGQRQVGYFCGTGCLRIRPDPARVHPRFLFEILRAPQVAGDIANRAKGSTMANLSAGALQGVIVPVPPRELQNRFATFADEVGEQIDTLDEHSRKLRTARDLLLPRLMSGELTV